MPDHPLDHVESNRSYWDSIAATYLAAGERNWAGEPTWGIWGVPERDVGMLGDVSDCDSVELGCGTGYVSAWLARLGARPVGLDNSSEQLGAARAFQRRFDIHFPLIWADAERAPLRSGSFDLAISEYGAAIWCDPYRWIPEAARLLRPGGRLAFLSNSALLMLCVADLDGIPAGSVLRRDYFGMHRFEWPDDPGIEFHIGHGAMIRLLRECGFDIDALVELRPPLSATTNYDFVELWWARRWPSEEAWLATKRG